MPEGSDAAIAAGPEHRSMGIPLFSGQTSPILVDFGQSSIKCLQVTGGASPSIVAAAELPIPPALRDDAEASLDFVGNGLPDLLRRRGFRGRRVVAAASAASMTVQHLQLAPSEGVDLREQVKLAMATRLGRSAEQFVIRSISVGEVHRDGTIRHERICFATPRDEVMRVVEMFRRHRYSVVGMHDGFQSVLRAFAHLHRREEDRELRTLYIDLGWSHTKAAIAHGDRLVFAKCIPVGGRNYGTEIGSAADAAPSAPARSEALDGLDAAFASLRLAMGRRGGEGSPPRAASVLEADRRLGRPAPGVAGPIDSESAAAHPGEVLEQLGQELSMCIRYYQSVFPESAVDRAIFVGGEARRLAVCQSIARALRLPAQLGDPLARLGGMERSGLAEGPHPGWAVACGLGSAPADL
jgi:Tfp pilus assembly PilM family ATPase